MSQTLIEKIVQKYSIGLSQKVKSGDFVTIQPEYVMTHDNTGAVIPKFKSIGAKKLFNPKQVVITLDHDIQNKSEKNLDKYKKIEQFSIEFGADFYPAGRGIGHQIMVEEGYAFPGKFVVASDSHSNMYGGIGCLGTPIVRTDAASIWSTGKTWWQIPPIAKVTLNGKLRNGVYGKDVIIALCGYFNNDEVLNHAIEFTGEGVSSLSIDERLTISNMTTEWGALVGLFPIDDLTIDWLFKREKLVNINSEHPRINKKTINELVLQLDELKPDSDAFYHKEIIIDLDKIQPFVSGPNSVKIFQPVKKLKEDKIKIDKAYLVSCVNSRVEDLTEAAKILKDKKIAQHVKFYIAAASSEVQKVCEENGVWHTLLNAGAIPLPPGCGPCIGLGTGLLEDGEVGISATNRNFKGRMGSPNAKAYLASPAVVAKSALSGYIDFDWDDNSNGNLGEVNVNQQIPPKTKTELIHDFSKIISGEIVFCYQDNINTDGIYPGKYTYNDEIKPEEQAKVVMENYDVNFSTIAKNGDILVTGFNFGTGSSREQAATAFKYKGIKLIIAGSFNETYKRNAINNGLIIIECEKLAQDFKKRFNDNILTLRTNIKCEIDFENSFIKIEDKFYNFPPLGKPIQEIIANDGLENWIKKNIY
ncbi:MAG: homoaconitase [Stygiobacter sp.]